MTRQQALNQAVGVAVRRNDFPEGVWLRRCDSGKHILGGLGVPTVDRDQVAGFGP